MVESLHSHPIGELLKRLAVESDGDPGVSIKGELHTVLNLGFPTVLHRSVRVVFVPRNERFVSNLSVNLCLENLPILYLTKRRESFLMLTRLLKVFTGSWGAGVTYGN